MGDQGYKIVPDVEKSIEERIRDLREYLAANIAVNLTDKKFAKVAIFQQHLDLVELLVKHSHDRI